MSVVVSVVCMCSCDWRVMFVVWYASFLVVCVWSFDMFRRWYYVVCMGCLLYSWCVCNCVQVSRLLCDTVIHICMREMYVSVCVSDICSWEMTVMGCGVCAERLCVARCQCVCCVDLCGGVLVVLCVLI